MHSQFRSSIAGAALALCFFLAGSALAATRVVINSLSPTSGPLGTVITVTGSGFLGATSARSGVHVTSPGAGRWVTDGVVTVVSATEVKYTMPKDGGTGQLYIGTHHGGTGFSPVIFTVTGTAAPTLPAVPSAFTAAAGNASVALAWTASSGATSYHVKRATASGGPYTQVAAPNAAAYTDTGLTNGTPYYYVVSAVDAAGESANSAQAGATPSAGTVGTNATVTVTVTPASTRPISPYIYGINGPTAGEVPYASVTLNRLGGDRWTAYNWQNNYSNAGSDYLYENDNYLSSSTAPLAAITPTIDTDRANHLATLITVPMLGFVAADGSGPVPLTNPIAASRFKSVVFAKGSAFTATPSSANASVYDDEMVWALDQHYAGQGIFSSTPSVAPVFIELDNEPDLWSATHQEVETSTEIAPSAYFAKTVSLSSALKKQFPEATIMGPANYGYAGFFSWQGGWSGASNTGYNWFLDGYLSAVDAAASSAGNILVDAYSLHWYSEATDSSGTRVTNLTASNLSADSVQAIVQSPRSLWDPSYVESSWITKDTGIGAIQLIPRVLDKIAHAGSGNAYAVSKMAITEYFNGGNNHIAGTVAEADNLGIFGAQGLYAATLWPIGSAPYLLGAFASFRNFDGAGHSFGDTSVAASSSNIAEVAAYVSKDSTRPGRVVMVLINRSVAAQTTAVSGQPLSGTAHLFCTTASSASAQGTVIAPVAAGTLAVSGSTLTVTLPALSVTTVDIY
jgi:hypothetical protein